MGSLYLAKLELRVRRESHEGPTEEFLELQNVVKLDGTTVLDTVPWSASQIVQTNLSNVFNAENISGLISNREGCAVEVYRRFAMILTPREYCVDLCFESLKSSRTAMSGWICKLTTSYIASARDTSAEVDLKRACQLVIEDTKHWPDNQITDFRKSQKYISTTDNLLGTVIRGGISLDDQTLCGEALSVVRAKIPESAVVDALENFGFGKLLCDLDAVIHRFKHIHKDFKTFIRIHSYCAEYKDSKVQANILTWMKSRAEQSFVEKQLKFGEDGGSTAKVGIICGETYLKEALLPAVILDIRNTERLYHQKSEAVFRFLEVIVDGQRNGNVGTKTARHVFRSILQVFIPLIEAVLLRPEHDRATRDRIPVKGCDILRLIHQCVSLELRHEMYLLFSTLDMLSMAQSATTIEGFSLSLEKELDEMPPGQTRPICREFYIMAHHVAATIRKQLAFTFHSIETRAPSPSAAKSVNFTFNSESGLAHYKTYQLAQITKRGFKYTCAVTPIENNSVGNYSVTVKKNKAQFAMGTQEGDVSQDKTEKPKASMPKTKASPPKSKDSTPKTKASTTKKNKWYSKR